MEDLIVKVISLVRLFVCRVSYFNGGLIPKNVKTPLVPQDRETEQELMANSDESDYGIYKEYEHLACPRCRSLFDCSR